MSANNLLLGNQANIQSGQAILAIGNVVTAPVSLSGLNGGVLYVESGHLRYIGASGTITTVASA